MNQLFQRLNVRKNRRRKAAPVHVVKTPSRGRAVVVWPRFALSEDTETKETSLDGAATHSLTETSFDHYSTASPSSPEIITTMSRDPYVAFVNVPKLNESSPWREKKSYNNDYSHDDEEYDSDGYHRYDHDESGHYVKCQLQDEASDPVVRMALQASQKALLKKSEKIVAPTKRKKTLALLDKCGNDLYEQGKLDQAALKYQEALEMKRQSLLLSNNNGAKKKESSSTAEEQRAQMLASMATSINNLTYLKQINGTADAQETLASYETALQIKRDILGPNHLSVGKTLNNIGSVHYLQHNHHEAAEAYEQARDILIMNLGEDHLDVCTVTSNLGDVHCCLGQWKRAVTEYRAAVKLRWKLLGRSDPKVVRLMEQIAELEMKICNSSEYDDDDDDDDGSASDDEERNDVNKLRAELQDDIDFFECLQQKAAIDMIKDKTCVFKEIRELVIPKAAASPSKHDKDEEMISSILSKNDAVSQRSVVSFPEKTGSSVTSCRASPETGSSPKLTEKSMYTTFELHQKTSESMITTPACNIDFAMSEKRKTQSHLLPQESLVGPMTFGSSSPGSLVSPSQSTENEHQPPASPTKHYTSEERNKALLSVKERVAKLRAAREQNSHLAMPMIASVSTTPTSPILRPYMGPTKSSKAKLSPRKFSPALGRATTPSSSSSALLKASELLTMKQGINALRGFPNNDGASNPETATAASSTTVVSKRLFSSPAPQGFSVEKAMPAVARPAYFVDNKH